MEFPPSILGQKSPRGIGLISIFTKILCCWSKCTYRDNNLDKKDLILNNSMERLDKQSKPVSTHYKLSWEILIL